MKFVIGIDSGGSKTRALAVGLDGQRIGYVETGGGNPVHDSASLENVRQAIRLSVAECGAENVVRIVAGIAGLNGAADADRIAEATRYDAASAARIFLNDTEIAHYSAHEGAPGIVSIQGTGSLILAILENGRRVNNGDFSHYAPSGAVRLGMRAVVKVLAADAPPDDPRLLAEILSAWSVDSIAALREVQSRIRRLEPQDSSARAGTVARSVTRSAEGGFGFAEELCQRAATEIVDGIRLLGPLFQSVTVPVALVGACVRSRPVRTEVERQLAGSREKQYRLVEPTVAPVVAAVQMALRDEGVVLSNDALVRLSVTA